MSRKESVIMQAAGPLKTKKKELLAEVKSIDKVLNAMAGTKAKKEAKPKKAKAAKPAAPKAAATPKPRVPPKPKAPKPAAGGESDQS